MWWYLLGALVVGLCGVALYDVLQPRKAVLRNFPVVGHLRYLLEAFGPELRQYIVTNNDEERPFSRDQRRWVYSSAKCENNYFGFGSDNDFEPPRSGTVFFKHSAFPHPPTGADADPQHALPAAKMLGVLRSGSSK